MQLSEAIFEGKLNVFCVVSGNDTPMATAIRVFDTSSSVDMFQVAFENPIKLASDKISTRLASIEESCERIGESRLHGPLIT